MSLPNPDRIDFTGPEGWTVWMDEDGCHIKHRSGPGLEQPDVEALFSLWTRVKAMKEDGVVPAPKRPTRDEIREMGYFRAEQDTKRRIQRAIDNEFDPPNTPF